MTNKKHSYMWLDEVKDSTKVFNEHPDSLSNKLDRTYDKELKVTEEYIESLTDLQNGPSSNIQGSHTKIQQVGIHNFKIPLTYKKKDGGTIELETSVTGTVSLEAEKKGINMSRIMRSFYEYKDRIFSIDVLDEILSDYKFKLGSYDANISLSFSFPIIQNSLRSGLKGYQYYNVSLEAKHHANGPLHKYIHFDYEYSSACPCSFELALQAMEERNKAAISHSQRSKARITIEFNKMVWIEDLRDMCLEALQTETQVMVKREDEQAFAELNGANIKFVEDAARLLHEQFEKNEDIIDYKIVCSHNESLHSHNAISVLIKGIPGGLSSEVSRVDYQSLNC